MINNETEINASILKTLQGILRDNIKILDSSNPIDCSMLRSSYNSILRKLFKWGLLDRQEERLTPQSSAFIYKYTLKNTPETTKNSGKVLAKILELLDEDAKDSNPRGYSSLELFTRVKEPYSILLWALADELNRQGTKIKTFYQNVYGRVLPVFTTADIPRDALISNRTLKKEKNPKEYNSNFFLWDKISRRIDFPDFFASTIVDILRNSEKPLHQSEIILKSFFDADFVCSILCVLERDGVLKSTRTKLFEDFTQKFYLDLKDIPEIKTLILEYLSSINNDECYSKNQAQIEKQCRITNAKAFIALSDLVGEGLVDYKKNRCSALQESLFFYCGDN